MSKEPTPIKFTCYKCKSENTYPAVQGDEKDGAKVIIKRCINCSAENKVKLPEGWVAQRTAIVFRGLNPNA